MLRGRLQEPLLDVGAIEARLDAVAALVGERERRERLGSALSGVRDLERLLSTFGLSTKEKTQAAVRARSDIQNGSRTKVISTFVQRAFEAPSAGAPITCLSL